MIINLIKKYNQLFMDDCILKNITNYLLKVIKILNALNFSVKVKNLLHK